MGELAAKQLDEHGRCCGRKPIHYKTHRGMGGRKDPHYFCCRCCAEFGPDGKQRANWKWLAVNEGFIANPSYEPSPSQEPSP